ncbi:hypothetical protein [Acidianus brierleyi]|uniref:Uncharacterized protein n=1 Tax=Acidianus brierleyi TaxID=41673 RepID=A0A2U9IBW4_9CREN|nr:hypothetical protein [Acidianus brierleyi]AWR93516.1 hypothetical protein DFR85_01700 [Acidianus brierleyi]
MNIELVRKGLLYVGIGLVLLSVIVGDMFLNGNMTASNLVLNRNQFSTTFTFSEPVAVEVHSEANVNIKGGNVYTVGNNYIAIPTSTELLLSIKNSTSSFISINIFKLPSYIYMIFSLILTGVMLIIISIIIIIYIKFKNF